jgi:hypothetical protein
LAFLANAIHGSSSPHTKLFPFSLLLGEVSLLQIPSTIESLHPLKSNKIETICALMRVIGTFAVGRFSKFVFD